MTEIHDLLEIALRFEHLRATPPLSLRINLPRQRDGPARCPESLRPATRRSGSSGASQHDRPIFDWRSRGMKP